MMHRKAVEQKRKALEPQERFCYILQKKVSVLVEYPNYKNPHMKGEEGSLYCSNIITCYHNDVKCRYSGISPLFRDPFLKTQSDLIEEEIEKEMTFEV
jgi:hypothetical protein